MPSLREERVYRYLLPDQLDVLASMEVTPRKLGIYQAQVYHLSLIHISEPTRPY